MIKRINNRHSILIISYLVITVLIILSGSLIMRSIAENRIALRYSHSNKALWLAEAGLQKGMWELNNNNCAGFKRCNTIFNCSDCTCSNADKCLAGSLGTSGDYDVTLNSGNTSISSTGSYPGRSDANKIQKWVKADVKKNPFSSAHAIFSRTDIEIGARTGIDSYNSSLGDYGGSNVGANAHVGANGSSHPTIEMRKRGRINGNASTGPGGTVLLQGGATVTGTITHENNVELPAPVVPASLTSLPSGGAYTINAETKTLSAGDYKFNYLSVLSGQLNINGNVNIYLTNTTSKTFWVEGGPGTQINIPAGSKLTIYCNGEGLVVESAVINPDKNPQSFTFYSTVTRDKTALWVAPYKIVYDGELLPTSKTLICGTIYAPDGRVKIYGPTAFFGSVVANSFKLAHDDPNVVEDTNVFHYDEALNPSGGGASGGEYSISNWREFTL